MSVEAVRWAFDQPIYPAGLKIVLVALAEYANQKMLLAFPAIDTLAVKTSQGRATVFRHVTELLAMGLIADTGKKCGYLSRTKIYRVDLNVKSRYNGPGSDPDDLIQNSSPELGLETRGIYVKRKSRIETRKVPNRDSNGVTHIVPITIDRTIGGTPQVEIPPVLDETTKTGTSDPVPNSETHLTPRRRNPKTPGNMRIPTLDEVKFAAAKTGLPEREAEKFFSHFESNGWKVGGKAAMKNWIQALNGWKLRWQERQGGWGTNGFTNGNGNGRPPVNPVAVRIALENELKRCELEMSSLSQLMQYSWDKTPERIAAMKGLRTKKQQLLDQIATVPLR